MPPAPAVNVGKFERRPSKSRLGGLDEMDSMNFAVKLHTSPENSRDTQEHEEKQYWLSERRSACFMSCFFAFLGIVIAIIGNEVRLATPILNQHTT